MDLSTNYDKWVEVDIDAVRNNLAQVQTLLDDHVRLIAVVKANAYGHGLVQVAQILHQQGVDYFAVSYLQEALELREAGIEASILVFCPVINDTEVQMAIEKEITLTVTSRQDWERIERNSARLNRKAIVHIKVDTGLGRFGVQSDQAEEIARQVQESKHAYLEGMYTHMAHATNQKYTRMQFRRFMKLLQGMERDKIHIPLRHCANSPVLLNFPEMQLDAVRIGTLISGQHPAGRFSRHLELEDPYAFKTRIISVRSLPAGSYLGYYRTHRLKQDARVAVLPVGFIDGMALEVANRPSGWIDLMKIQLKMLLAYLSIPRFSLQVEYRGQAYPVRGKVFMQMTLVEFPVDSLVAVGDEVTVPIRKTLASPSVSRLYVQKGEAGKISAENGARYIDTSYL